MKKITKIRNGIAIAAKLRHGGPMRDKRDKRAEENKHPEFIEELDCQAIEVNSNTDELSQWQESSLSNQEIKDK